LLRKVLCCRQRGLLRGAIGGLLRGQLRRPLLGPLFLRGLFLRPLFLGPLFLCCLFLGTLFLGPLFLDPSFLRCLFLCPLFPDSLFPDPLFLGLLFLGLLFLDPLFLGQPCGAFHGLLCGEFGGGSRCLPRGLFCFQTCGLFRGLLGGAVCFLLRGLLRGAFRLAGSRSSGQLGQARLLLFTSPHDCQILLFRGAPGVSGLNFFRVLPLLFFPGLLGAQARLLPRLRPCCRKIPVFRSVQIRP
jgi:hypothetical protein